METRRFDELVLIFLLDFIGTQRSRMIIETLDHEAARQKSDPWWRRRLAAITQSDIRNLDRSYRLELGLESDTVHYSSHTPRFEGTAFCARNEEQKSCGRKTDSDRELPRFGYN